MRNGWKHHERQSIAEEGDVSKYCRSKNVFCILLNSSTWITFNSQLYISSHRSTGMTVGTIRRSKALISMDSIQFTSLYFVSPLNGNSCQHDERLHFRSDNMQFVGLHVIAVHLQSKLTYIWSISFRYSPGMGVARGIPNIFGMPRATPIPGIQRHHYGYISEVVST